MTLGVVSCLPPIELDRLVEFVQGVIERVDGCFLVAAEIGRSFLEPILDGFDPRPISAAQPPRCKMSRATDPPE
jgi:hypothetical protein